MRLNNAIEAAIDFGVLDWIFWFVASVAFGFLVGMVTYRELPWN